MPKKQDVTFSFNMSPKAYEKGVKERVKEAQKAIGQQIAKKIAEAVIARIPDDGGWLKLYKGAITFEYEEARDTWVVFGDANLSFEKLPAERTLVEFESGSGAALILKDYNLWAVDTIPAIQGGIDAVIRVLAASTAEVATRRAQLHDLLPAIKARLQTSNLTLLENGLPKINGQLRADLAFLSKRLEHGLGGFPRVPHWRPAIRAAQVSGARWVLSDADTMEQIQEAFERA